LKIEVFCDEKTSVCVTIEGATVLEVQSFKYYDAKFNSDI